MREIYELLPKSLNALSKYVVMYLNVRIGEPCGRSSMASCSVRWRQYDVQEGGAIILNDCLYFFVCKIIKMNKNIWMYWSQSFPQRIMSLIFGITLCLNTYFLSLIT